MKRGGLLVAAVLLVAAPLPEASAKPSDAIVMTASGGTQDGAMKHARETKKTRTGCMTIVMDGPAGAPAAVQNNGNALLWKINDARKPLTVKAAFRRYVAPGTTVVIATGSLPVSLREVKQGTKVVAWEGVSGKLTPGNYVIDLTVEWKGACGSDVATRTYQVFSLA